MMKGIDISTVRELFTKYSYLRFDKAVKVKIIKDDFFNKKLPVSCKLFKKVNANNDLTLQLLQDKNIACDGYKLLVSENKSITITSSNKRGAMYALDYLIDSITVIKKQVLVPIMQVEDYPSFKLRGVIEGYYGIPYMPEVRVDVINTIRKYKMNTYMYAPKFDPYHRSDWRDMYEGELLEQLLEVFNLCKDNNIDFYYCISPGLDFDVTKEEDYKDLFKKIKQMIDYGINNYCLLLDDIDYALNDNAKALYSNPGEAHSYICNRLYDYLESEMKKFDMIMCPTEYYDSVDTEYKRSIGEMLNKEVKVFWTGYHTIAEVISDDESMSVRDLFKHNLVLWDNFPVNDFLEDRVFLAPLTNRSIKLNNIHYGMLSNPMQFWYLSKMSVITMADYMWNSDKYNEELAMDKAIRAMVEPKYYNDLKNIAIANYSSVLNNKYGLYYEEILLKGEAAVIKYYESLIKSADNLAKSKSVELYEQLEPWCDRIKAEYELIIKVKEGSCCVDEIVEVLNDTIQVGTDLLKNYLLQYKYLTVEDYNERVLGDKESYYSRVASRPVYWNI